MSAPVQARIALAAVWSGILALTTGLATAAELEFTSIAVDKSAFNLFHPTPTEDLREMTTDGPGLSASPYTVDAGHFQIEMSFFDYAVYEETFQGFQYRLKWSAFAPMTLKVGLLNRLDLQLLIEPYNRVHEFDEGITNVIRRGFGDTTVRLKYNVWGNDNGLTAGAVMPFVIIPTAGEGLGGDRVEGGVILPFSAELPWEFFLSLTSRFATAEDILDADGHHGEFSNSIGLSHQLCGDLEGYVEFFSNVSTEQGTGWIGTFDTGLIYWLTEDLQLNTGVNIGVTDWADDWNAFVGLAWRY